MWLLDSRKKSKIKKRRKLIAIFTPISIGVVALSLGLGLGIRCKSKPSGDFINVPVNDTFYRIENGVVEGFSKKFLRKSMSEIDAKQYLIDNCSNATDNSEFCMNLHNQKITGEQYAFSPLKDDNSNNNINNILSLFTKLDFSDAQWQWDSGFTGNYTFGGTSVASCDFAGVKILDLEGSNFAVMNNKPISGDVGTAYRTFAYTKFPSLKTLNLSDAVFATNSMTNNGTVTTARQTFFHDTFILLDTLTLSGAIFAIDNMTSGRVETARSTFAFANFKILKTLNLSKVIFVVANMTQQGDIFTACCTFTEIQFDRLETLDLSGVAFATTNITNGTVNTAYETFSDTIFSNLKTINFNMTIFATPNMTTNGNVYTSDITFSQATFSSLENLNLSGAVFAANSMTTGSGSIHTAYYAFRQAKFISLKTLNFGNCKLGDSNTGDNTINDTCFEYITKNSEWSSTKLRLSADNVGDWTPAHEDQLKTWFGDEWTF